MKEKIKIFNKIMLKTLTLSIFVLAFSFNISLAYVPNSTYTSPSGTVYTGLLVDLFTSSPNSDVRSTNLPGGSPGFTGPSGFNINGFTGENSDNTPSGGGGTNVSSGSCRPGQARNFRELILNLAIGCILSPLVYLIIAASVIVFLFGVFKFIKAEGDDKQAGREFIIWGIVGLFVMVSVWGLVSILTNTFSLNNTSLNIPRLTN